MGEIFTSGKFVIFWYDCPITNKRKKKQVSISAKVSEAAAYAKAEKLQKELERSFDDGNYTAEDKPFGMALNSLQEVFKNKSKPYLDRIPNRNQFQPSNPRR